VRSLIVGERKAQPEVERAGGNVLSVAILGWPNRCEIS
jgi:hypothetical protein